MTTGEKQIKHTYTNNAICPHCGYEHVDSWEFEDSTTTECHSCEKPFHCYRYTDVTYNTKKASSIKEKP